LDLADINRCAKAVLSVEKLYIPERRAKAVDEIAEHFPMFSDRVNLFYARKRPHPPIKEQNSLQEKRCRVDPSPPFLHTLTIRIQICSLRGFNMLLAVKTSNTDLPPTGFCIEPLLGSKYAGSALVCCVKSVFKLLPFYPVQLASPHQIVQQG